MSCYSIRAFLHQPSSYQLHGQLLQLGSPLMATLLDSRDDDEFKNQKYLRIQSRTVGEGKRKVDFQTAIVTMTKTVPETGDTFLIDIHAQCHFGDKVYFEFYNDRHQFTDAYDRVHYELLISKSLLSSHPKEESLIIPPQHGNNIIAPSPQDSYTSKQYNLYSQLDIIDYSQPHWIHCDYTREEFVSLVTEGKATSNSQPIWAMASSTQSSMPALEFISAFTRPLTPSTPLSSSYNRRLFSNLFISGDVMISCIRLLLWFLIPSPELSVILLDLSSLFPRPSGTVSRIINPVLTSLFTGDFHAARKLIFAQMLTSSQATLTHNNNGEDWIVKKRNKNAIEKIHTSMERYKHKKHAILYGALHGQDLQKRLETLDFHVQKVDWRTAWSVTVAEFGTGQKKFGQGKRLENERISWGNFATTENREDLSLALVIIPFYLIVGGLDWLDTVQTVKASINFEDWLSCFFTLTFYLVRHVALYLSISKFVIDWDGQSSNNQFEGDEKTP